MSRVRARRDFTKIVYTILRLHIVHSSQEYKKGLHDLVDLYIRSLFLERRS